MAKSKSLAEALNLAEGYKTETQTLKRQIDKLKQDLENISKELTSQAELKQKINQLEERNKLSFDTTLQIQLAVTAKMDEFSKLHENEKNKMSTALTDAIKKNEELTRVIGDLLNSIQRISSRLSIQWPHLGSPTEEPRSTQSIIKASDIPSPPSTPPKLKVDMNPHSVEPEKIPNVINAELASLVIINT